MPGTLQQFPDYTAAFSLAQSSRRGITTSFVPRVQVGCRRGIKFKSLRKRLNQALSRGQER